jgi:hypothetical protein
MVALDTNTVCYGDAGFINVHQLHSDKRTAIDSLSGFSFFKSIGKLGQNICYSGGGTTVLVHITNDITGLEPMPRAEPRITISPNPSATNWNIESSRNGRLSVYGMDGKRLFETVIEADKGYVMDARYLASGVYFYRLVFDDHQTVGGKLIRH